jgi:hypothetical protein
MQLTNKLLIAVLVLLIIVIMLNLFQLNISNRYEIVTGGYSNSKVIKLDKQNGRVWWSYYSYSDSSEKWQELK